MKMYILCLCCIVALFMALLTSGYTTTTNATFQPSEKIPADTEVSFPVDI